MSTHPDAYRTIVGDGEGDFRDRGSKFPAYAFPCVDLGSLTSHLQMLKKVHPTARHHCYGAVIGDATSERRAHDDGEPSGTAGLPILNEILSTRLVDTAVVVVRYFGGIKLGKPGLINAYRMAARSALDSAPVQTRYHCLQMRIEFDYDATGAVMQTVEKIRHARLVDQRFADRCQVDVAVPRSLTHALLTAFDYTQSVSVHIIEVSNGE